jgi:hypothetical protein
LRQRFKTQTGGLLERRETLPFFQAVHAGTPPKPGGTPLAIKQQQPGVQIEKTH